MRRLVCKFIFILFVLILSFSSMDEVKAYGDNYHVYHVKSLDIKPSSATLDIDGFAYINQLDNYGGINLRSWIVATNSSGQSVEYEVDYYTSDENTDNYNYYYAICQESSASTGTICNEKHAEQVLNDIIDGSRRSDSCNKANGDSDCGAFSVDFKVNISLTDLHERLGGNGNISFKIKTITSTDNGNYEKISDLGVYEGVCKVDGTPNLCSSAIQVGDSSIVLGDISKKVQVVVTSGRIRPNDTKRSINGRYYITGMSYDIVEYGSVMQFDKKLNNGNAVYFSSNYFIISGSDKGWGNVSPGGPREFIIYDSWVHVDGSMTLSFDGDPEETIPVETVCDPGFTEVNASKSVTCGNSQNFKACTRKGTSVTVEYQLTSAEYNEAYLSTWEAPDNELAAGTDRFCGNYEISFDIYEDILIHESGTFNFGGVSSGVYAGRGFDFPNLTYINDIYWRYADNNVSAKRELIKYGKWNKEEKIVDPGGWEPVVRNYSMICSPAGFDEFGNELTYGEYYDARGWLSTCMVGETIGAGDWSEYEEVEPVIEITWTCDSDGSTTYVGYYDYMWELNNAAEETVRNNINESVIQSSTPISYDSNVVSSTEKIVEGSWNGGETYGSSLSENSSYHTQYQFDMTDSHVKLIGDNAGNVAYSNSPLDNYQHIGNKYFVPLLFPNDRVFPLNISRNNISFVNGIYWYLDGECGIVPINNMFDCNGGSCESKFRYRPIELDDPFPKDVIPVNWVEWYSSDTNKHRLINTYNNGFVYSVTLVSGISNGNKLGIDNVNNINTNYNSWNGMKLNGTSSFVTTDVTGSYFNKNNTNSYCNVGVWNVTCDDY